MVGKSNKRVCKGSAKNIGYYFRTTFPVATDETMYYFRTPTDFGRGGVVVLDGKVIKQVKTDIWQGGKSTKLNFNATLDKGNHLLEYWGAEGCCDGTFSWSFRTEDTKWMQYSTKNFNNLGLAKQVVEEDDDEDWSDRHKVKPLPLRNANIYVKTMPWKTSCVKKFSKFQQALSKDTTVKGYCEVTPNSMAKVSNAQLCKGGSRKNIGYYYRTVFPNVYGGSEWCFRIPSGFVQGAVVMFDGKIVSQTDTMSYDAKKPNEQLNFCMNLTKGNHVIEIFGASKVDYETAWYFQVDSSTWYSWTLKNMNRYRVMKQIQGKTTIWFGKITVDQKSRKVWHTV
jgi:hypothetical protein